MSGPTKEIHLGDDLYARFDGFTVWLRDAHGNHVVGLEPGVLAAFQAFLSDRSDRLYLGDGLCALFDGCTVWLRAPGELGDPFVGLDPYLLAAFQVFLRAVEVVVDIASQKRET